MFKLKIRYFLFLTIIIVIFQSCGSKIVGKWIDDSQVTEYKFNSDGTYIETDLLVTHNHEITGKGTFKINNDNSITLTGTHQFYKFVYERGSIFGFSVLGITEFHQK